MDILLENAFNPITEINPLTISSMKKEKLKEVTPEYLARMEKVSVNTKIIESNLIQKYGSMKCFRCKKGIRGFVTVAGFRTYHIKCFAATRLGKQVQKEWEKHYEK